jgi:fumarate reductase flavoprotein subunit
LKKLECNENFFADLALLDAGQGAQYSHVGMPTTAHGYMDGGVVALKTIHEKVKSYGGQVMYETPGESLIKDANGKITGVVAKKADGTELRINAKSVVLATGGFGGNEEMMKAEFGEKAGTGLIKTATGDGVFGFSSCNALQEYFELTSNLLIRYT